MENEEKKNDAAEQEKQEQENANAGNETAAADVAETATGGAVARISGKDGKPVGLEDADVKEDILMPRVAILQGLSEMVVDRKGDIGDLADSLSKENFGKELTFIPLFLFKTCVAFKVGEGLVMMSRDGITISQASEEYAGRIGQPCADIPEAQWVGSEPPLLSKVFNYPSLIEGRLTEMPISFTFLRTGMKAGKILTSLIARSGEDAFARKYKLTTKTEKNDKGTFAVPVIELVGRATDEEYQAAKKWALMFRARPFDVDYEGEPPNFEE